MYIIKNNKFYITRYVPITMICKSYSKILDVNIKMAHTGLILNVSYLEDISACDAKIFNFLIKRVDDQIESGYTFLRSEEILVCDTTETYFIFYNERCGEEENRNIILNNLGI